MLFIAAQMLRPLPGKTCTPAGAPGTARSLSFIPRAAAFREKQQQRGQQRARPPGGGGRRPGGGGGGERLDVETAPAWRVFGVSVAADDDPGKDDFGVHPALLEALARKLPKASAALPAEAVRVVRKSFDARPTTKTGAPAK